MKMLKVTLLVLLTLVTFDIAHAASPDFHRRDRERRRHERYDKHHRHDRYDRRHDRGPRNHGYQNHGYSDHRGRY